MSDKLRPEDTAENQNLLSLYDSEFLESIYLRATQCDETSESYRKNASVLRSISGYRDSSALAKEYEKTADELEKKEKIEKIRREERERAEAEKRQKKSDECQIRFYTVGIIVLSLFLIFLICYNTFLGGLIKKRKVLEEIYPLTYDDITVLTKKEAPWLSINDDGELFFVKEKYEGDGEIVIPDVFDDTLITSIADNAFARADGITEVIISDHVETIGERAFEYCTSLRSVKLSEATVQISTYAFHGCSSLESISLPNTVIRICDGAFSGCSSLKEVSLPRSVEYIEKYAFQNCTSLESLTFGKNVKIIEIRAFSNCTVLTTVYYEGSKEDLDKVDIDIDNGPFDDLESEHVNIIYDYSAK